MTTVYSLKFLKNPFWHLLRPRWALLWLVVFAILASSCDAGQTKYCGEKLVEILDSYCNGTFKKKVHLRRRRVAVVPTEEGLQPQRFKRLLRQLRAQERRMLIEQQKLKEIQSKAVLKLDSKAIARSVAHRKAVVAHAHGHGHGQANELAVHKRRCRGIVDDCCDIGCTFKDIEEYCQK